MNNKVYNVLFVFIQCILISFLIGNTNLLEYFGFYYFMRTNEKYAVISLSIPVIILFYLCLYWCIKKIINKDKEKKIKSLFLPIVLIIIIFVVAYFLLSGIYDLPVVHLTVYLFFFAILFMILELFKKKKDICTKKDIILMSVGLAFIIFTFVTARINGETLFREITPFVDELSFKSISYYYYSFYFIPVYLLIDLYTAMLLLSNRKK